MRRWTGVLAATAALGVGALALGAPAASAVPGGATIDPAARAAAEAAITARLADLNARVILINQTPAISTGDRSSLLSEIGNTVSGLQALATTISNETSVTAFRTEAADIYVDYRVYALVLPQVHLVRAADQLTSDVVPALEKLQSALESRLAGQTGSAVTSALADLAQQITAIQTDTSGVSSTLLSLTPPQWNANHTVVSGPRQKIGAAYAAAAQAAKDVHTVREALR